MSCQIETYHNLVTKDINKDLPRLEKLKQLIINHISLFGFSNAQYFESHNKLSGKKELELSNLTNKLIKHRKGICMELNYCFSNVLYRRGFEYYLVKCYKPKNNNNNQYHEIFHLAIVVIIDNEKYFVDVGFGEYFVEPIKLENSHTNNIEIKRVGLCKYILIDTQKNQEIFKINGLTSDKEIEDNYERFFNNRIDDGFPLRKVLFETIYDRNKKNYVLITRTKL